MTPAALLFSFFAIFFPCRRRHHHHHSCPRPFPVVPAEAAAFVVDLPSSRPRPSATNFHFHHRPRAEIETIICHHRDTRKVVGGVHHRRPPSSSSIRSISRRVDDDCTNLEGCDHAPPPSYDDDAAIVPSSPPAESSTSANPTANDDDDDDDAAGGTTMPVLRGKTARDDPAVSSDAGGGIAITAGPPAPGRSDEDEDEDGKKWQAGDYEDGKKWQAGDYDGDLELLRIAMARQYATSDLRQRRRRHALEYGFARNRRPLLRDLMSTSLGIGAWIALFLLLRGVDRAACGAGAVGGVTSLLRAARGRRRMSSSSSSWGLCELRVLLARSADIFSLLHHWIVCMALPLVLLALVRCDRLGPAERALEEGGDRPYDDNDAPSFFNTPTRRRRRKARGRRDKDTGDFVLCLLENWSSAVVMPFVVGVVSLFLGRRRTTIISAPAAISLVGGGGGVGGDGIDAFVRLLTRVGAAAALHQYPSLLFELRRDDRPRPICRSAAYMQRAVKVMLDWLPLAVASDLAVLLGMDRSWASYFGKVGWGTMAASSLSILPPLCHLIALGRIVRFSKCSAVSLSGASTFPIDDEHDVKEEWGATIDNRRRVQWRYQLRWRTPQRLAVMLRTWRNYFFTGHVPLLLEMNEWNTRQIRFDDFSTEGTPYSIQREPTVVGGGTFDDMIPDADSIAESLSLIFRDREGAIQNATQARLIKHQESYNTKTLDDVLGVAIQQTFGIGLSYDFDHFDPPADDEEISIHQLRARMAKSAVRRKSELDGAMANELDVLRRLKDNVVTATNKEVAEDEMKSIEQVIRDRHANEVDQMRDALRTMIPTNADAPKGTERYDSPIMVAEYIDLKAAIPTGSGELKVTRESVPDSLSMIEEYVRRDFGDEAADAYRREEIAALKKEKEMLLKFRQRYGELKDDDESAKSEPTLSVE